MCLRASKDVEKWIGGSFGTGAGVVETSRIAFIKFIKLGFGLKESLGPTTGAIRKDDKEEGKYLLMVLWSTSFANLILAFFLLVRIRALAGGFVLSLSNGGSLFLRKLGEGCLGEGAGVMLLLAC